MSRMFEYVLFERYITLAPLEWYYTDFAWVPTNRNKVRVNVTGEMAFMVKIQWRSGERGEWVTTDEFPGSMAVTRSIERSGSQVRVGVLPMSAASLPEAFSIRVWEVADA